MPTKTKPFPLSVRLGSFGGTPVMVHISWLISFWLIAWSVGTAIAPKALFGVAYAWGFGWGLCLYACTLIHEFAHVRVAKRQGMPVIGVMLHMLGAAALFERNPDSPRNEISLAVAGPIASLLLAMFFAAVGLCAHQWGHGYVWSMLAASADFLAFANGYMVLLNLVPAYPMDGGRLLFGVLWLRMGDELKAKRAVTAVAVVLGTIILSGALWLTTSANPRYAIYCLLGAFLLTHALGESVDRVLKQDAALAKKADVEGGHA